MRGREGGMGPRVALATALQSMTIATARLSRAVRSALRDLERLRACRGPSSVGARRFRRMTLRAQVDEYRRTLVVEAIREHRGDSRAAAKVLGVPWGTFSGYLRRYGLRLKDAHPPSRPHRPERVNAKGVRGR